MARTQTYSHSEILQLYYEFHESQVSVARALGCHVTTVNAVLRKAGIRKNRGCRRIPDGRIVELFTKLNSITKVATVLGCSPVTVRSRLKKLGIEVSRAWKSVNTDKVILVLSKTESISATAKVLGITEATVNSYLAKAMLQTIISNNKARKAAVTEGDFLPQHTLGDSN